LVDLRLDVPAGRITAVREERVDAGNGLLGILGVHFIFCLAVLFGDRENTQSFQGFERVGGSSVKHSDTEVEKVTDIEKPQNQNDTDQGSLCENRCRSQDWWSRWDCVSAVEENRRKTAKF
jgi:hypothetical protein